MCNWLPLVHLMKSWWVFLIYQVSESSFCAKIYGEKLELAIPSPALKAGFHFGDCCQCPQIRQLQQGQTRMSLAETTPTRT